MLPCLSTLTAACLVGTIFQIVAADYSITSTLDNSLLDDSQTLGVSSSLDGSGTFAVVTTATAATAIYLEENPPPQGEAKTFFYDGSQRQPAQSLHS